MRAQLRFIGLLYLGVFLLINLALAQGPLRKITGTIVDRSEQHLTVRDQAGTVTLVTLTPATEIKEKKRNFFRSSVRYSPDQILLGLNVVVKGRAGQDGAIVATEIRFKQHDLKVAETVTSQVARLQLELDETQSGLEGVQSELAQTGQLVEQTRNELESARREARDAQSSADEALTGVEATNQRVTDLDEYELAETFSLLFHFDSADLLEEAKSSLDEIVREFKDQRGYLVEIRGFASSEGNQEYNRRLSERRAETVVRYLTENHDFPLRRIVTPYGYGEKNPIADNSSSEGRKMNRRVEVRVLLNRGASSGKCC